jgi:hypothetical protein
MFVVHKAEIRAFELTRQHELAMAERLRTLTRPFSRW